MSEILPIIIYILLIVLIIVAIAIGIKVLTTLAKVDVLLEDVTVKMKSLDKVFEIVDFATDRMSMVSEVVLGVLTSGIKRVFGDNTEKKTRKRKKKIEEEDEIDE